MACFFLLVFLAGCVIFLPRENKFASIFIPCIVQNIRDIFLLLSCYYALNIQPKWQIGHLKKRARITSVMRAVTIIINLFLYDYGTINKLAIVVAVAPVIGSSKDSVPPVADSVGVNVPRTALVIKPAWFTFSSPL